MSLGASFAAYSADLTRFSHTAYAAYAADAALYLHPIRNFL